MRSQSLLRAIVRLLAAASAAVLFVCLPGSAGAQSTSACRAADSVSTELQADIVTILTDSDSVGLAFRDSLGLLAAAPTEVVLVTNNKTCQSAAQAYRTNVAMNAASLSDRVYVFSVGRDRYVVMDPAYYPVVVGYQVRMVFTSRWVFKNRY